MLCLEKVLQSQASGATVTGTAAEPLKDFPWSLEMGEPTPVAADAFEVREGGDADAHQPRTTNSATRMRARRIICSTAR